MICFEHRPFVKLPCSCRVNYCASCWDRALATSVSMRGLAQCPSCREAFRVDFNPDEGGLVFSPDTDGTASQDWRSRLYGKAKPVQIQLLRDFGESVAVQGPGAEANMIGADLGQWPLCVCGAQLERVGSRVRIIRVLDEAEPGWRLRSTEANGLLERLLASAFVTCDLCEQDATVSGFVWTCQSGPRTVLHPAAYDVCDKCFSQYAGPVAARLSDSSDQRGKYAEASCQPCAAIVRSARPWPSRRVLTAPRAIGLPGRVLRLVGSTLVSRYAGTR